MKRPFFLVILTIMLVGLVLFGLSDSVISTAATSIPDNEATRSEANSSFASATINITMYAVADEQFS